METAITCTSCVPGICLQTSAQGCTLAVEKSDLNWEGGTIYPRTVGAGCPIATGSQVSSELSYPHPALSARILQAFLCEGRLPPPHVLCSAHPSHCLWLRATHSPAAGVGCRRPGSHSESLFFPENPAKWRRQCNPCSCAPSSKGERAQAQALGRRGCGAGQLIWANSLRQTLSALGVWEGNEEGREAWEGELLKACRLTKL